MSGISSKAAGTLQNKNKYNGKELQSQEFSDGSGLEWTDYGARMYDNQIGRWHVIDAMSEKTESITPYNYGLNNPVNYVDIKGYFSIAHHYSFTYNALKKFGYNSTTRNLVSHYSSLYADNPTGFTGGLIRFWENSPRKRGVDYSPTKNSQNTASIENSTWHSMRADDENISDAAAMARGQQFGWDKIFEAGSEIKKVGGMENLKKNSKGVQALGQGLHALQDAVAHQGTDMDNHDVWKDMQPGKKLYDQATNVTEGALLVTEIMSGNGKNLTNGMSINIEGMSRGQFNTFITNLLDVMKNTEGVNEVNLKNKPK